MVVVAGAALAGSGAVVGSGTAAAVAGSAVFAGVPAGVPLFVGDPFYMSCWIHRLNLMNINDLLL